MSAILHRCHAVMLDEAAALPRRRCRGCAVSAPGAAGTRSPAVAAYGPACRSPLGWGRGLPCHAPFLFPESNPLPPRGACHWDHPLRTPDHGPRKPSKPPPSACPYRGHAVVTPPRLASSPHTPRQKPPSAKRVCGVLFRRSIGTCSIRRTLSAQRTGKECPKKTDENAWVGTRVCLMVPTMSVPTLSRHPSPADSLHASPRDRNTAW